MLPTIGTVHIGSGTASGSRDTFIELANGTFSRKFGLNNWTWLRLAARISFYEHPSVIPPTPTATGRFNIPPDNKFFFGFSSGTGSVVGDQSTSHAWGISWTNGNALAASSWTNPAIIYSNYGTYLNAYKYQNGIETSVGQISAGDVCYITQATSSCQQLFFDLLRVSTTQWSTYCYYHNSVAYTDEYYPQNQFYTDMWSLSPSKTYNSYRGLGPFAHDEATYGYIDSVNISWNRDHPRIWLRDLHVLRLR